jgi:hypothetical protein
LDQKRRHNLPGSYVTVEWPETPIWPDQSVSFSPPVLATKLGKDKVRLAGIRKKCQFDLTGSTARRLHHIL